MTRKILQTIATCLALTLSYPAISASEEALDEMTRLLKLRLGTDQVETPTETGVEGVYQTRFGNKFAYLIENGRYVFIGDLVDLKLARNMTELSRRSLVIEELSAFSDAKQVVYPAEQEELAVLNVFTDTSCGYCQMLHKEVKHLQEAGISVHYFPFPRGGTRGPGYQDLKKVWCSGDKLEAMNIAKGTSNGSLDADTNCESAQYVDEGYQLGNRIGVTGTPALFTADGTRFNGYVPYQELIPQLIPQ